MLTEFHNILEDKFPELTNDRVLVACSGGLDSVALAYLCHKAGINFGLAHVNFGLRGKESKADASFVEDLAKHLGVEYFLRTFNTSSYANQSKLSIQESARELRYQWFRDLIETTPYRWVITAHNADDQLETFLMHLGRGAGLNGLCGIPARQGAVIRPLLEFSRNSLANFIAVNDLDFREDSSNATDAYLRNRVRHHVLPNLLETLPRLLPAFVQSAGHLKGAREILQNHISELRTEISHRHRYWIAYDLKALKELKPKEAYLYELFSPYGFSDFRAIEELLTAISGKEIQSPTHRLLRDREALLLRKKSGDVEREYRFNLSDSGSHPPQIRVSLSAVSENTADPHFEDKPNVLYVDKAALKQRLWLRKWQKGDYFCPLGMKGGKKVSKYFKDIKLNQFQKEAQWVLGSGDQIVWLPGLRADDRFKVTNATREIIKIEWLQE